MPGAPRWHPNDEPFSYTKLCNYYLPGLVLISGLLFTAFRGFGWLEQLDKGFPSSFLNVDGYNCSLEMHGGTSFRLVFSNINRIIEGVSQYASAVAKSFTIAFDAGSQNSSPGYEDRKVDRIKHTRVQNN